MDQENYLRATFRPCVLIKNPASAGPVEEAASLAPLPEPRGLGRGGLTEAWGGSPR